MGIIYVVGIGPGDAGDITPAVRQVLEESEVIVGYKYYFHFVSPYLRNDAQCMDTGMRREQERANLAFRLAKEGKTVCVISSGDAGIYGMASLILETKSQLASDVEVTVLPGISALQKAASLLGAPLSHDFCAISLSDLLTPWPTIERRIEAAATADFVTAVYNPRSNDRYWQLTRLQEIFLHHRSPSTPVGIVRQAGREGERVTICQLADIPMEEVDMLTTVIIGNSQSYTLNSSTLITPRGYHGKQETQEMKAGQAIMTQSFRTISRELREKDIPTWRLWTLLHVIHTTADFDMERLLWMSHKAPALIYIKVRTHEVHTIITDVTMVQIGIRKGALQRLGVETKCYINDPRAEQMARAEGITRAQAGIRLAAQEHPDAIYAFGNAPTALLELCSLVRRGKMHPAAIVAAPVGFVHVEESKHAAKALNGIPIIMIEGRKGGSPVAATIVNSILTYDDSKSTPGRDV